MFEESPKTPMKFKGLPEQKKRLINSYPVRNDVKWEKEGDFVVITYIKNFGRFEGWIHRRIGGAKEIRRPLDEKGTIIWDMCDGEHTIFDICTKMDQLYKEDMEPVLKRVLGFIQILLSRGLLRLVEKNEQRKKEKENKD